MLRLMKNLYVLFTHKREFHTTWGLLSKGKEQPKSNYDIYRATEEDFPDILRLMRTSYFPDEPVSNSIGYFMTPPMELYVLKGLQQGLSLVAKCTLNGDVCGACINESTTSWDDEVLDTLACSICCPKTSKLLLFYAHVMRSPKLFEKYHTIRIFESSFVFVRKCERGKGIAGKLLLESRNLAADCGFTLYRIDATHTKTAYWCNKLKMKLVHTVPYCSYIGKNNKPVFKPLSPLKGVSVYIDDQPQKSTYGIKSEAKLECR